MDNKIELTDEQLLNVTGGLNRNDIEIEYDNPTYENVQEPLLKKSPILYEDKD